MRYIAVIGGINIDIEGKPYAQLVHADSNPGSVKISYGGVGRNICENIARLGGNVSMISVIGNDFMGQGAKEALNELGVNTRHIRMIDDESTAMYLSVLNHKNDMDVGICNMDILEKITPEEIDNANDILSCADIIALDTNLNPDIINYILNKYKDVPKFMDPVSTTKAIKVKDMIGEFTVIKPNRLEAEVLSGKKINSDEDVAMVAKQFLEKGVKRVFITLGEKGVYYADDTSCGFESIRKTTVVSATGGGDAFSAAVILGCAKDLNIKQCAKWGIGAATFAMESESAVNEKICMEELECLINI